MPDRSRVPTCLLGLVSMLGLGSGCKTDDCAGQRDFEPPPEPDPSPTSPATVVAGEWIGAGVLELEFSRPLSSLGDLDPTRFAIVGWDAQAYDSSYDDSCSLRTRYAELGGYSYYSYSPSGIAAAWIGPEDDTRLRLSLSSSGTTCRIGSGSVATGVLLVYTDSNADGVGPGLLDEDGDPLGDIGPGWAIPQIENGLGSEYNYGSIYGYGNGFLPLLTSLVPIPCP